MSRALTTQRIALALLLVLGSACSGGRVPTASEARTSTPRASAASAAACAAEALDGRYRRAFSAQTTDSSDLIGEWTLDLEGCTYRLSADGLEQGSGSIDLVEGSTDSGRVALSDDLGCPNEFLGAGLYDIDHNGQRLGFTEAIAGTDQCEGRAETFVGEPAWERE